MSVIFLTEITIVSANRSTVCARIFEHHRRRSPWPPRTPKACASSSSVCASRFASHHSSVAGHPVRIEFVVHCDRGDAKACLPVSVEVKCRAVKADGSKTIAAKSIVDLEMELTSSSERRQHRVHSSSGSPTSLSSATSVLQSARSTTNSMADVNDHYSPPATVSSSLNVLDMRSNVVCLC